jgi:hypothetical protein
VNTSDGRASAKSLPPVAQDALELTPEGKVLLRLRRPWRDGTRAIRFEPSELLERLAAMGPRPPVLRSSPATEGGRANLLIYHGAFAPRGCCREGTDPWPNEESISLRISGSQHGCLGNLVADTGRLRQFLSLSRLSAQGLASASLPHPLFSIDLCGWMRSGDGELSARGVA